MRFSNWKQPFSKRNISYTYIYFISTWCRKTAIESLFLLLVKKLLSTECNLFYLKSWHTLHKYLLEYFFTHEKRLEINFSRLLIENGEITILHINCSLLGNEHESYPISPTATFFQMTFSYLQIKMIWIWNWIQIRYIYIIFALQQSRDCKDEKWEKSQFYTAHYKPRWFHFRLLETKVIPIYHPKGFYSLYNHAQAPSGRAAPPKTFFFLLYFFNFQMTIWTCENWLEQKKFTLFVTIDEAKTKDAGIWSD